jgi:hypothetical protein
MNNAINATEGPNKTGGTTQASASDCGDDASEKIAAAQCDVGACAISAESTALAQSAIVNSPAGDGIATGAAPIASANANKPML